jgi:hypothetical protein
MNRLNKVFLIIILILSILLIIMTSLYLKTRKEAKNNLDLTLENAQRIYELNKELQEYKETHK